MESLDPSTPISALARALAGEPPRPEAREAMLPPYRSLFTPGKTWRPAAVLILAYPGPAGEPVFPLIRRVGTRGHHRGEYALPGGGIEDGETPWAAALRETHEELGIPVAFLEDLSEPLSLSPLEVPPSGYRIEPFIACATTAPRVTPDPAEAEDWFEIPLAWLLEPRRRRLKRTTWGGSGWNLPYFDFDGPEVWGATAMILAEFGAILAAASA